MDTTSLWRASAPPSPRYAPLPGNAQCDVLVVGGGITGVTLAWLLAGQGRDVLLLEAQSLGGGSTAGSTGNLYESVGGEGVQALLQHWGKNVARQAVEARAAAVDFIGQRAQNAPEVAFRRCLQLVYAQTPHDQKFIDGEYDALAQLGATVARQAQVPHPLPAPCGPVLALHGQAQFQPQAYVTHLAREAAARGARLHEHSRVTGLDHGAKTATTASATVQAREIVLATHSPKGFHLLQAAMPVHREYGLALPWSDDAPGPGIHWWHGPQTLSVRTHTSSQGEQFLVCVGQEHKTGNHDANAGLAQLREQVQRILAQHADHGTGPGVAPRYQWSAQNYRSAVALPYIGRDASGCWVATGFGADGLVWGTVAAQVLAAQLAGDKPDFGEVCRPSRFTPLKSAKTFAEAAGTSAKALLKDYLTDRQEQHLTALAAGESAIVEAEGESFAAYRAPGGELFAVSPVCTHLGCKVHWNSVETSWDCPCHGSRFAPDGTLLEGPALVPLARKHLRLDAPG